MMKGRVARRQLRSNAILLVATVLTSIAAPFAPDVMRAREVRAQVTADDTAATAPIYAVASIRPVQGGDSSQQVTFRYTPDGMIAKNMTLQLLIRTAYGVYDSQIVGAPNWLDATEYDIEAKTDDSEAETLQRLGVAEAKLERQHMLQALLADRFKLIVHHESREGPLFVLVVARDGPKFQRSGPDTDGSAGPKLVEGNGKLIFHDAPIAPLVTMLSQQLGRIVLDKTGLKGKYDFALQWTPDEFDLPASDGIASSQQGNEGASSAVSTGGSIFTALQEDLGLKLESTKGPVDVIVIDHVEEPSEN
jgi:uncharacterized protein (TIGR03435 family)